MRWPEAAQLELALVLFGTVIGLLLVTIGPPTWAVWGLLVLVGWFLVPAFAR